MELTGQCKEDFEKYRLLNYKETASEVRGAGCDIWECIGESMQYGVYVDFFDSVGIDTRCKPKSYEIYGKNIFEIENVFTRKEAREQAITKANELYNER